MRPVALSLAFLASVALGVWGATYADEFLVQWFRIPAGDQRVLIGQGIVAVGIAYFVGAPLWKATSYLFPRRRPLIPCPDCENLVSKLATLCPHCGRPLEPVVAGPRAR